MDSSAEKESYSVVY